MIIIAYVIHVGKLTVYDVKCEKCGDEERVKIRTGKALPKCKNCKN